MTTSSSSTPFSFCSCILLVFTTVITTSTFHVNSFPIVVPSRKSPSVPHLPTLSPEKSSGRKITTTSLHVIPELGAADFVVAVASAAAGAASQIPRIRELEKQRKELESELENAYTALSSSKQELSVKITELEDSIFEMDREFEGQTSRMKRKYDDSLRKELDALSVKLKQEYQVKTTELEQQFQKDTELKLDVQEGNLRQQFLKERLEYLQDNGQEKRKELSGILEQQAHISRAKTELENALMESKKEIERLVAKKQSSWWPF
uniref:Uncharacterized protein n=1 Tax=Ditylum brightwellii TaxID=49249 RepID=A0A7S4UK20_9STRA